MLHNCMKIFSRIYYDRRAEIATVKSVNILHALGLNEDFTS